MNPDTLKKIWEKDGEVGILKYGNVALRRALTSTRSNFYYKYEKYYTHIDSASYNCSTTFSNDDVAHNIANNKHISNIANEEIDNTEEEKLELINKELNKIEYWYDRELFKLYYTGETLDSLAAKTRISRNSIFTTIDKVRTIIKNNLNEDV